MVSLKTRVRCRRESSIDASRPKRLLRWNRMRSRINITLGVGNVLTVDLQAGSGSTAITQTASSEAGWRGVVA